MRSTADTDGRLVVAIHSLSIVGQTTTSLSLRNTVFAPVAASASTSHHSPPSPISSPITCGMLGDNQPLPDVRPPAADGRPEGIAQAKRILEEQGTSLQYLPHASEVGFEPYSSFCGMGWPTSPPAKTTRIRSLLRQPIGSLK
ncbi:hypothetical protein NMY22_g18092 [Coprinellus aureogranulatus]|nr:hypothetical protein NMY22_g18092 [Coprinellus aureogranulatus]